jgi:hypothetical protein
MSVIAAFRSASARERWMTEMATTTAAITTMNPMTAAAVLAYR